MPSTDTKSSAGVGAAPARPPAAGHAIESAMLRLSGQALAAHAEVIRRVLGTSTVADDLDELSVALGAAAVEPPASNRPALRLVI